MLPITKAMRGRALQQGIAVLQYIYKEQKAGADTTHDTSGAGSIASQYADRCLKMRDPCSQELQYTSIHPFTSIDAPYEVLHAQMREGC